MQQTHTRLATEMVKGALAGAGAVWLMDQVGSFLYRREDPQTIRQEADARVEDLDCRARRGKQNGESRRHGAFFQTTAPGRDRGPLRARHHPGGALRTAAA